MESDILWCQELEQSKTDLGKYRETWLRVCKNISQSGKSVILCGSETPENLEGCVERRYFSKIYYLALVCEDDILRSRLRSRPTWRGFTDELINKHISFNRWFKSNAQKTKPPITLLDTSSSTIDKSVETVAGWINLHLKT